LEGREFGGGEEKAFSGVCGGQIIGKGEEKDCQNKKLADFPAKKKPRQPGRKSQEDRRKQRAGSVNTDQMEGRERGIGRSGKGENWYQNKNNTS